MESLDRPLWAITIMFDVLLLSAAWALLSMWTALFLNHVDRRVPSAKLGITSRLVASVIWPVTFVAIPVILIVTAKPRAESERSWIYSNRYYLLMGVVAGVTIAQLDQWLRG